MIKSTSKTIGNTATEQKDMFLDMLFRTLGTTLLGKLLARKYVIQAGEETIQGGATATSWRRGHKFLQLHPLNNFEI